MSVLTVDHLGLSRTYLLPASCMGETLAKKPIFAFPAIIIQVLVSNLIAPLHFCAPAFMIYLIILVCFLT